MNKREQKQRIKTLTDQIRSMEAIEAVYAATFSTDTQVPEAVYDAWNAAHDAKTALEFERRYVENYSPVPAGQEAIYQMIRENRD
jgi:hypothetical protein